MEYLGTEEIVITDELLKAPLIYFHDLVPA